MVIGFPGDLSRGAKVPVVGENNSWNERGIPLYSWVDTVRNSHFGEVYKNREMQVVAMPSYLNTEPDLDEHESILEEYPAEIYLVERNDPAEDGSTYRFHAPAREAVTFDDEERARLFADLYTVLDGFRIRDDVGERGIPVNVATAETAAIAAYMYSAWGSSPTEIAQTIEGTRETVLEYLEAIRKEAESTREGRTDPETPPGELG